MTMEQKGESMATDLQNRLRDARAELDAEIRVELEAIEDPRLRAACLQALEVVQSAEADPDA